MSPPKRARGRQAAHRVALAVLPALAVAVALACCQNVLGIEGQISLSTKACGLQAPAGDCRTCIATQCCNEANACASDPQCAPAENCLLGCGGDYACRARCVQTGPFDKTTNSPVFETCLATHCNDACELKCGMSGSFTDPDAAQTCEDCLGQNCGATATCTGDLGCALTGHCVASCSTPDCRTQCLDGDGGALFIGQAIHAGLQCLQQCEIGSLWACVGTVAFPLAELGDSDVTLTFNDAQTNASLQGILVKACPSGPDQQCTNPVSMGTTGKNGSVTLGLPMVQSTTFGFSGYFDLTMPVQPPLVQHYLYFLSWPLSVQHAKLSLSLYSPSELQNLLKIPSYTPDPTRGMLEAEAFDCLTIPAQNVTFVAQNADDKTLTVYQQGTYLNAAATATDRSGTVFFLNAPTVPIKVEATPIPLGRVSSIANVFVSPGALSIVQAIPTQQ
jgi:hypothetical protein